VSVQKISLVIATALFTIAAASTSLGFCRGKPLPEKQWFFVLESGFKWRISNFNNRADEKAGFFTADWGYMRNLNRRSSLGATLSLSGDHDARLFGFRPRYRLWLNRRIALDLSPGTYVLGMTSIPT
jgi:hypothetical protein